MKQKMTIVEIDQSINDLQNQKSALKYDEEQSIIVQLQNAQNIVEELKKKCPHKWIHSHTFYRKYDWTDYERCDICGAEQSIDGP